MMWWPGKTPLELKRLALDYYLGHVITSLDVPAEHLTQVFWILDLMRMEMGFDFFKDEGVGLVYAYLHDPKLPWSMNGRPSFLTCRFLRTGEARQMIRYYWELWEEIPEVFKRL